MKLILRFVPLILVIAIIGGLTMQDTTANVNLSEKCRVITVRVAEKYDIETEGVWWNEPGNFRKVAHTVEYFFLGMTVCFAVRWFGVSVILCAMISIGDQMLKRYIPIRHFDMTDLPFDAVGYVAGVMVMFVFVSIGKFLSSGGEK